MTKSSVNKNYISCLLCLILCTCFSITAISQEQPATLRIQFDNKPENYFNCQVNIVEPGMYKVILNTKGNQLNGLTVKSSCGGFENTHKIRDIQNQAIAYFRLKSGKVLFSLELIEVEGGTSLKFSNSFSIDFKRIESLSGLSHNNPTVETVNLFKSLKEMGKKGMIFGQHFSHLEGQNWRERQYDGSLKSDCYTAVGDHPGIHGLDFGRSKDFLKYNPLVKEIFRQGGISTYSWHANNPITNGNSKDCTPKTVTKILEKGKYLDIWKAELDKVAKAFHSLEINGIMIPVIFRPFHENTGNWFWWANCTDKEYKELWQLSIDYLRIEKKVKNMLVAYSPSKISENETIARNMYPGDHYVDIIGFDAYATNKNLSSYLLNGARLVSKWATATKKVAAITEFGIRHGTQNSTTNDYFMSEFLNIINSDAIAKNIAYALTWRNSKPDSYWVPLPEQPNYDSFSNFYKQKDTYFLQDLNCVYGK